LKLAVFLAMLAGVAVTVQVTINATATRTLGLAALISISGFATGLTGLAFALASAKPELTARTFFYGVASGVLGCVILACVTYAAGMGGVARALSLLIASQLIASLFFDYFGFFGAEMSLVKFLGVALIIVGGVLVVRF
jgi:bacterial/archaeal transporter family-2 protein